MKPGAKSYIHRAADKQLHQSVLAGQYCTIIGARQTGKSSLVAQTVARMRKQGLSCATVDLQNKHCDRNTIPSAWYLSILSDIAADLSLSIALQSWWDRYRSLPPHKRFVAFFEDVVLEQIPDMVTVFIDEVDSLITLPFRDKMLRALQTCFDRREKTVAFRRLTFVLIGAEPPPALTKNRKRNPFSLGQRIVLTDFSKDEVQMFASELGGAGETILARTLYWTDGHPYLTQKICALVVAGRHARELPADRVNKLVNELWLSSGAQRKESNLKCVSDFLNRERYRRRLLNTYRRVLIGQGLKLKPRSIIHKLLLLSGVVKQGRGEDLQVRNRVYETVFNEAWAARGIWKGIREAAIALVLLVIVLEVGRVVAASSGSVEASNLVPIVDRFWVLLAAVLVFLMQAGYKCLKLGTVDNRRDVLGVFTLLHLVVLSICYYVVGFSVMFGRGVTVGLPTERVLLHGTLDTSASGSPFGLEYFLYYLALLAITGAIVGRALANRASVAATAVLFGVIGTLIYPVVGHWAWNKSGLLISGWLPALMGNTKFHDFSGSTVVHSVGAWISFVGFYSLGSRHPFHRATDHPSHFFNGGYSVLGAMIIWFGCWGFNGGARLGTDNALAAIVLNTNLAGVSAGLAACVHAYFGRRSDFFQRTLGGFLGGLVASSASCDVLPAAGAVLLGISAGLVHNIALDYLRSKGVNDPDGILPVHGACGVWGTMYAGFAIWWWHPGGTWLQVPIQLFGIVIVFAFTVTISAAIVWLLRWLLGGHMFRESDWVISESKWNASYVTGPTFPEGFRSERGTRRPQC